MAIPMASSCSARSGVKSDASPFHASLSRPNSSRPIEAMTVFYFTRSRNTVPLPFSRLRLGPGRSELGKGNRLGLNAPH